MSVDIVMSKVKFDFFRGSETIDLGFDSPHTEYSIIAQSLSVL